MKNFFFILSVVGILLSLAACSNDEDTAVPLVALTDVAAEAIPTDKIVPADVNEVVIATGEMILTQPVEAPLPQSASGEPSAEPAAETTAPPA